MDCGNLNDYPNNNYKKLFDKFKEIDKIPISEWGVTQVLGYFCHKYFIAYGSEYKFKYNSPTPSKCFEVFQIKKLGSIVSSKPQIMKDYIDWVFDTKVKNSKKLTSISFLTVESLMVDYKKILMSGTIDRAKELPNDIMELFKEFNIKTYGDLAFLNGMDKDEKLSNIFKKLSETFDLNKLNNIK